MPDIIQTPTGFHNPKVNTNERLDVGSILVDAMPNPDLGVIRQLSRANAQRGNRGSWASVLQGERQGREPWGMDFNAVSVSCGTPPPNWQDINWPPSASHRLSWHTSAQSLRRNQAHILNAPNANPPHSPGCLQVALISENARSATRVHIYLHSIA